MYFVQTHGEKLFADVGVDPTTFELDLTAVKDAVGVDRTASQLTYRELQERRELIRSRFEKRGVS
jgi:ubiquinone biosynthesis protein